MLHRKQPSFVYRNLVRWSHFASSGRGWCEDLCLHVRWQIGIDGKDDQFCYLWSQPPASILEHLATCFDFFLKKKQRNSEKNNNETLRYFCAVVKPLTFLVHPEKSSNAPETDSCSSRASRTISYFISNSTCPVRNTRTSPVGWVTWICSTDTTQASR